MQCKSEDELLSQSKPMYAQTRVGLSYQGLQVLLTNLNLECRSTEQCYHQPSEEVSWWTDESLEFFPQVPCHHMHEHSCRNTGNCYNSVSSSHILSCFCNMMMSLFLFCSFPWRDQPLFAYTWLPSLFPIYSFLIIYFCSPLLDCPFLWLFLLQ